MALALHSFGGGITCKKCRTWVPAVWASSRREAEQGGGTCPDCLLLAEQEKREKAAARRKRVAKKQAPVPVAADEQAEPL